MVVAIVALMAAMLTFLLMTLLVIYIRQQRRMNIFYRLRRYNIVEAGVTVDEQTPLRDRLRYWLNRIATPLAEFRPIQALDLKMRQAGVPLLGGEFMIFLFGSAGAAALVTWMLTLDVSNAFLIGIMTAGLIWGMVSIRISRRRTAFTEQLGDCLITVANALRAGYSFQQAMEVVAREMEPPISDEFAQVTREVTMSVPLESALEGMNNRVGSADFDLVVTAVLIQREVGGNLAQILDSISDTIHERIRMKREIYALTAQGRLSAWVLILMPFGLALMMYLFSRDSLMLLITEPLGRMALLVTFILEIIGYVVIQRIVHVDV